MGKRKGIGQQLLAALTGRQIAAVLDAALVPKKMDVRDFLDRLATADQDAAHVLENLLENWNRDKAMSGRVTPRSTDKLQETWTAYWREWYTISLDVGNEEGRYVVQEAHWEPPYFDSYTLSNDLEKVAKKILPLLEEAYERLDLSPNLFLDAFIELQSRIEGYPEWMGAEHGDPCQLGPETTACVLQWLWLNARDKDEAGLRFLKNFQGLLAELSLIELDQQTCEDFFADLPDEDARRIYHRLREEDFDNLDGTAVLDEILEALDQRFDPEQYLTTCRQKLAHGWQYGLPLIEDAQNKGDLEAVETWLTKTFSVLLPTKDHWLPEDSLLLNHPQFLSRKEEGSVCRMLDIWANTAQARRNPVRAAAAHFQKAILADEFNIQAVLQSLADLSAPETEQTLNHLFQAWKGYLANISGCPWEKAKDKDVSWVHWLVEAARMGPEGREFFSGKLKGWLASMQAEPKLDRGEFECLECLTADLVKLVKLSQKYPAFSELLQTWDDENPLHRSRQELLRAFQVQNHLDDVLAVWSTHLARLVPDPASTSQSRYERHAKWMNALLELDPSGYQRVLADWRAKHSRRRNLWTEMREQGLPV